MNVIENYQPSFLDCIVTTKTDDLEKDSFRNFCEFWASWYCGGTPFIIYQVQSGEYQKEEFAEFKFAALLTNISRVVVFPLTLIALVFKTYYRFFDNSLNIIENEVPQHDPVRQPIIVEEPTPAANQNQIRDHRETILDNAIIIITTIREVNLDFSVVEPLHILDRDFETLELLCLLETILSNPDEESDTDFLIAVLTLILNDRLEQTRIRHQEIEEQEKRVKDHALPIKYCTQAWEIANMKNIDCSNCLGNDMAFIGKLTFYKILMEEASLVDSMNQNDLNITKKDLLSSNFNLNVLLDIFIFDTARDSDHKELDEKQVEIDVIKNSLTKEQSFAYHSLLQGIHQLYGAWMSEHRQEWNTIFQQGMLAAEQ